jgi:hypothetical protein
MLVDLGIDPGETGLELAVRESGPAQLTATIGGTAEMPAVDVMGAFVDKLHTKTCELKAREVVVDLTSLEFMNSSCFKSLVTWLNAITDLEPGDRYKIRFRSNPQILWQRRSLHVLQTMGTDVISVETV